MVSMAATARRATRSVTSPSRESNKLDINSAVDLVPESDTAGAAVRLTRSQVADRLGMSLSTVRRLEGDRLHPKVGADNVRWFDANEVAALAKEILAARPPTERRKARSRPDAVRTA